MKPIYIKLLSIILISCLGFVVYSNTFHCSFHFDDQSFIIDNNVIKDFRNLQNIWNYYPCRFFTFLSLALNYHFNELDVFGFHMFNLTVHVLTAILVWWLTFLTLSISNQVKPKLKQPLKDSISGHANLIALSAGLIFVSHPVQTEAVTYIWQRTASLAALFYIASLCFYVKSKNSGTKFGFFYTFSLLTAIMAMLTKETTITLPLMILLYEFTFFKDSRAINWKHLSPFLLTLFIIPSITLITNSENVSYIQGTVRIPGGISPLQYVLTQFNVMVTYLRLMFLPIAQNLDYDFPISRSILELPLLGSFLLLTIILFFAQRVFQKYKLVSFSIFWIFLTSLPEANPFPVKDVIFEHRLYLPLAGYSMLLACGIYYLLGKKSIKMMIIAMTLIVAFNSILTYQRNKIWKDELTLWDDTIKKSPHKARPYNNRGKYYLDQGNLKLAITDFNKAIDIDPNYEESYSNRGVIYEKQGQLSLAMLDFNKAIEIHPYFAQIYINRGSLFSKLGNYAQAIMDDDKAIKISPDSAEAYNNRGSAYNSQGNFALAIEDYDKAIELNPKFTEAYNNRCLSYEKQGDLTQAIAECSHAIGLNPLNAETYNNRGYIYIKQNNFNQALADFNKALEINPDFSDAYTNRGIAFAKQGNFALGLSDFSRAIDINPKNVIAYTNRGLIYSDQKKFDQAILDLNKAIDIDPNHTEAYYNRGNTYYQMNNFIQAVSDYSNVIKLSPDNSSAYSNRAISYFQLKEFDNSWSDVHKARKLGASINPNLINALKTVSGRDN